MLLNGIWLIVLGILGASSLVIAKKPEAKGLIDKLAPFQGWIGFISACWGAWGLINILLHLGVYFRANVLLAATCLAVVATLLVLGLLLGVGVMKTFIRAPAAVGRLDATITRLAPFQGTFGLVGIGLGVWMAIASVLWGA